MCLLLFVAEATFWHGRHLDVNNIRDDTLNDDWGAQRSLFHLTNQNTSCKAFLRRPKGNKFLWFTKSENLFFQSPKEEKKTSQIPFRDRKCFWNLREMSRCLEFQWQWNQRAFEANHPCWTFSSSSASRLLIFSIVLRRKIVKSYQFLSSIYPSLFLIRPHDNRFASLWLHKKSVPRQIVNVVGKWIIANYPFS